MGKGKSKESIAQEKKNLLGINTIADHAGGSWMSKHSISGSGSNSPLYHDKKYQHTHEGAWDKVKNTVKDTVDYKESGRNRSMFKGGVSWKSDDWSSGYSAVQNQFKKAAPKLSGKK